MYAEACRILLQLVKQGVRRKVVEKNLHLVYALVYNQRDFNTILKSKSCPFRPTDTEKIRAVIKVADELINKIPNRTASLSMEELRKNVHLFKGLRVKEGRKRVHSINSTDSVDSDISDSTMNGMEDFKFTYEEEADPETFFLPYTWSVIVCTATSSMLEWDKKNIKVFPIMHHAHDPSKKELSSSSTGEFVEDVDEMV